LHPYRHGRYVGSGQGAAAVLREGGLDGESQAEAIASYVDARAHGEERLRRG